MSKKFSKASAYLMSTEHQKETEAELLSDDLGITTSSVVAKNQKVMKEIMDTQIILYL